LTNWITKEDPTIFHLINTNKNKIRMKGQKKIYQAKGSPKQAEVAIFITEKVDFKNSTMAARGRKQKATLL
jgi:hypothetical protein